MSHYSDSEDFVVITLGQIGFHTKVTSEHFIAAFFYNCILISILFRNYTTNNKCTCKVYMFTRITLAAIDLLLFLSKLRSHRSDQPVALFKLFCLPVCWVHVAWLKQEGWGAVFIGRKQMHIPFSGPAAGEAFSSPTGMGKIKRM